MEIKQSNGALEWSDVGRTEKVCGLGKIYLYGCLTGYSNKDWIIV